MKLLVCLGNVPDTTTKVRFSSDSTHFDTNGVQWVINPWDELALTRALELKEDGGNPISHVTVATVGGLSAEPTIRKALAIGADDAIRVDIEATDAAAVAAELAAVVKSDQFDIVICGIESSDYNGNAVGGMLSEILEIPSVSAVSGMKFDDSDIILYREIDGGSEEVSLTSPFVAIVQKGFAKEPRIPAMRGIMMARKKPLKVVPATGTEAITKISSFELPTPKPPCKMIDADNVAELVSLLQTEAKML
ncbi:MAG: electron transfer flavoprotein subunit beta/FixA family protein [Bacteroidales bacterium]|nr:electron transfer flavoprotein subunit beta/FixA family protein [Bacteroidales bacterium]